MFLGQTPSMVVATTFLKSQPPADMRRATVEAAVDLTARVAAVLSEPDVALGRPAPGINYAHRRGRDADMYFAFNESDQPESRKARLAGSGQVQVWDAATVEISTLTGATDEKSGSRVPLELKPWEPKVLVLDAAAPGSERALRAKDTVIGHRVGQGPLGMQSGA